MSILPRLIEDFNDFRPSRLLDQHFGMGLHSDDMLSPFFPRYMVARAPRGYMRPWSTSKSASDAGSTVICDKDKFQVNLDVQHFNPDEIKVKVDEDNTVTIEGEHAEKQDEHGFISRKFVRKYLVPKGHDVGKLESRLSSDGVLTITAPKLEKIKEGTRSIPIQQTGVPSKVAKPVADGEKQGEIQMDTK